jgi:hypothetical protein
MEDMADEKKDEAKQENELETSPSSTSASFASSSAVGGDPPSTNWMKYEPSKTKENIESMRTTTEEATPPPPTTTSNRDDAAAAVAVLEDQDDIGGTVELPNTPLFKETEEDAAAVAVLEDKDDIGGTVALSKPTPIKEDKMDEIVDRSTNDTSEKEHLVIEDHETAVQSDHVDQTVAEEDEEEEEIVFIDEESSPIQGVGTTRFSEDDDNHNKKEFLDVTSPPPDEAHVGESSPSSFSSSLSSSFGVGILQVMALVRKNLLVKYRTPTATFFELFSPLLMILILSAAFSLSEIIEKDAQLYTSIKIDLPGPWTGLVQNAWNYYYLQQQNGEDMDMSTTSSRQRQLRRKQQQQGLSSSFVPWYENQEDDRVMTHMDSWNNIVTGVQKKIHRVLMDRAALESVKPSRQRRLQVEDTNVTENDKEDGADGSTHDEDDGSIYDLLDEAQSQVSH